MLLVTFVLTDIAILRLHAPYARTSEANRAASLTAAARIVSNLTGVSVEEEIQPIIGVRWTFLFAISLIIELAGLVWGGVERLPERVASLRWNTPVSGYGWAAEEADGRDVGHGEHQSSYS